MNKSLLIAALLFIGCSKNAEEGQAQGWGEQPALPVVQGQATFSMSGSENYVNVMGNTIPRMPLFPSLSVKGGIARGYVADLSGKPLKGAHIGLSSTMDGGWYSSGSGITNDNGYYEFTIPTGAAYFFGTAVTVTYNETPAVMALYPVGGTTSFPSGSGVVKNFVLLSYGPANPEAVAQQPNNESNYYGGALLFNFHINYEGDTPIPEYLPENGVIEIELIPLGTGLYGETKSFKITKKIGNMNAFNIHNIPVGKYTINAKMSDGRKLKMNAIGTKANVYEFLGLKPDNAVGTSTVTFTPNHQYTPVMVPSFKSNWDALEIGLKL
ncbi:carboxypeptidase-like regulatory domain-containing protein [Chitinophaga costaii]|uniref:carboxypeptidase-like regulatory domain-containing protein n=1 Tax=Chitinophaga costaii TaxID=1335309 RepID=UPI000F4DBAAF|nr:carboxypeptidase-like regulatory domain-containing protein [Chitinophaga costaii]